MKDRDAVREAMKDAYLATRHMDRVEDVLSHIRSLAGDVYEPECDGECGHINEDYPEYVCARPVKHKGGHKDRSGGARWWGCR